MNHFDQNGQAVMVDVSGKPETSRTAIAAGGITMSQTAFDRVCAGTADKGDVLGTARLAGILACKKTPDLIPLCHVLVLSSVTIEFSLCAGECAVEAVCTARCTGRTGVEMEALTGVSVALLTIYDMCKAIDKGMTIRDIRLLEKTGGKSGRYQRAAE